VLRTAIVIWLICGSFAPVSSCLGSPGDFIRYIADPTSTLTGDSEFGGPLATCGSNLAAGAPGFIPSDHTALGCAYLFDTANGDLLTSITRPHAETYDFGRSVAITTDTLVVGSGINLYFYDVGSTLPRTVVSRPANAGTNSFCFHSKIFGRAVYVTNSGDLNYPSEINRPAFAFSIDTGQILAEYDVPTSISTQHFGYSIAVREGSVYIGSRFYLFEFPQEGGQARRIIPCPPQFTSAYMASDLSIPADNVLLVGCFNAQSTTDHPGIVGRVLWYDWQGNYLRSFAYSDAWGHGWQFIGILADDGNGNVLMGAPRDQLTPDAGGSAFFVGNFRSSPDLVNEIFELLPPNNPNHLTDGFATSVAASGNRLIIGQDLSGICGLFIYEGFSPLTAAVNWQFYE